MIKSKPQTRFSLTEEQERRQILIQIKTLIIEKADKYKIKEPESAILQIQELCGGEVDQAIRVVVKNLINRQEFEKAKSVCDKFAKELKSKSEYKKYINSLRNETRNAEIGHIVLTAINMKGTIEEERRYFELINKGLERGNVKTSKISLGKSSDSLRNITLADIWETEPTR